MISSNEYNDLESDDDDDPLSMRLPLSLRFERSRQKRLSTTRGTSTVSKKAKSDPVREAIRLLRPNNVARYASDCAHILTNRQTEHGCFMMAANTVAMNLLMIWPEMRERLDKNSSFSSAPRQAYDFRIGPYLEETIPMNSFMGSYRPGTANDKSFICKAVPRQLWGFYDVVNKKIPTNSVILNADDRDGEPFAFTQQISPKFEKRGLADTLRLTHVEFWELTPKKGRIRRMTYNVYPKTRDVEEGGCPVSFLIALFANSGMSLFFTQNLQEVYMKIDTSENVNETIDRLFHDAAVNINVRTNNEDELHIIRLNLWSYENYVSKNLFDWILRMGENGEDVLEDAYFAGALITFIVPGADGSRMTLADRHIIALIPCGENDAVLVNSTTESGYVWPLSGDTTMSVMDATGMPPMDRSIRDFIPQWRHHHPFLRHQTLPPLEEDPLQQRRVSTIAFVYYSP